LGMGFPFPLFSCPFELRSLCARLATRYLLRRGLPLFFLSTKTSRLPLPGDLLASPGATFTPLWPQVFDPLFCTTFFVDVTLFFFFPLCVDVADYAAAFLVPFLCRYIGLIHFFPEYEPKSPAQA